MLVRAFIKCDINNCTNTHEVRDKLSTYGTYMERPQAHTFKQLVPHLGTQVPDYMSEITIDICQEHYDQIRQAQAFLYMQDKQPRLRRTGVKIEKNEN